MFVKGTFKKVGILLTIAVLPFLFGYVIITFLLFSAIAFLMQFFRDPNRITPLDNGLIIAPADGRVLKGKIDCVKTVHYEDPMMEYILRPGKKGILVSTFMSPFDVHVNRAPISGTIVKTKHYPGKFKIAMRNVLTENEKNLIVIDSEYGKVGVIQIAGFVARRIVQYVEVGDQVQTGDRLGMIRFGSRVDLIIPYENTKLMVSEGEKPTAGETVIARMHKKT
ncbi:archaetidylserine decarboxylase [Methanobacterium petrolearium]|uniref:archaetidylserine decarboxylase n=1 Tax=Methanobacterium petrolearium TaxID=710190 RepID=UPI001AE9900C|nr:archaetidylserine decarboxylase [Methanobacterium petrolearium]MBP1945063.1 phosphatidylserine decarboxylase [Methanobacterium petrolearium]BDZ70394.1 phosphatidylserine decarboxylase proenzyme [Methanobacterium petrolearium]